MNTIHVYDNTGKIAGTIPYATDNLAKENYIMEDVGQQDEYEHREMETSYANYNAKGGYADENVTESIDSDANITNGKVLPERYNEKTLPGYIYYKGERISEYRLLEIAVETGEITLDESKSVFANYRDAWDALIASKAKPLFGWSTTLYSEDGMYKFRVEGGIITGAMLTHYTEADGAKVSLQSIAKQLASGISPCDIKGDVSFLMWNDRELYDAAYNIGIAKRRYEESTNLYQKGQLTKGQYLHDLYPVFLLLYGKDVDIHSDFLLSDMKKYFSEDGFLERAFSGYNPDNQKLVNDLVVKKGYHAHSGLY